MDKKRFKDVVLGAIKEYLEDEEGYGDSSQLQIDPETKTVEIVDMDADSDDKDYYMIMDLVKGSETTPGSFEADEDAVDEVVSEYFQE